MVWCKLPVALMVSVLIIGACPAEGGIIADFGADMQPGTPKAGWSYLWNPTGVALGDAAGYANLDAVAQPNSIFYDTNGSPTIPGPDPGAYLFFGANSTTGYGHPGRGSAQASDGLEHYAIAGFTVSTSGQYSIVDSDLTTTNSSIYGIHVRIFVNDIDTGVNVYTGSGDQSVSFNTDLGFLSAGDTIYVAVGAGAIDYQDAFNLEYQISGPTVPEPSSLVLFALGGSAFMCFFTKARRGGRKERGHRA
jgi:hypothetical protein